MIPHIGPVRLEFVLFALTLVGVALFHTKTMWVALGGLASVLMFKWIFIPDFYLVAHTAGGHGQEGLILLIITRFGGCDGEFLPLFPPLEKGEEGGFDGFSKG